MALVLLELVLFWWPELQYNPEIPFFKSLVLVWGPSFYLYIKNKNNQVESSKSHQILQHYFIFSITLILLIILKIRTLFSMEGDIWWAQMTTTIINSIWIKAFYFGVYFVLIIRTYFGLRNKISILEKNWIKTLIVFYSLIFLITCFRAEFAQVHSYDYLSKYIAAFLFSGFILIIGLLLFLIPILIKEPFWNLNFKKATNSKYKNSGLTKNMLLLLRIQLVNAMENKKLYLDHTLTLQSLADSLNTDRYSLSQVINQEFKKNFYEFINDYRITESIRILKKNPERMALVSDLVYESGFNNKVSFYKAFKKRKKMTPARYMKANTTSRF